MSPDPLAARFGRLKDLEDVRELDPRSCRLLGDGHATPLLLQSHVQAGERHVAAGRHPDTLMRARRGWLHERRQIALAYFCPLRDGRGPDQVSPRSIAATYRPAIAVATER